MRQLSSTHPPAYDVAIVGSGFCGSMLAVRLALRSDAPLRIALIDGAAAFGNGVAFGTTRPEHLLNVPAGKMSAFPESPEHFLTWLRTNKSVVADLGIRDSQATDFLPRAAYGRYLSSLLSHALAANDRVTTFARRVVDVAERREGVDVEFEDGNALRARRCVLAVGNEAPIDPPAAIPSFLRSHAYERNPWSRSLAEKVDTARDVLLIGSGLTAIDVALTIGARNPRARVIMLSRRGRLPHAHSTVQAYDAEVGEILGRRSIVEVSRILRSHIRRAHANGSDWRAVVDALRPHTQRIWQDLSPDSKRRFLRHARPLWEIHRHRAAPAVDAAVRRMLASGMLEVHAGRIAALVDRSGRALALFARRGDHGALIALHADVVDNCTGPRGDYAKSEDPLWRNLIARGAVRPDSVGLGIDVNVVGAAVNYDGRESERLFAVGALRRGTLYESTAVPELRQQVMQLATVLAMPAAHSGESVSTRVGTAAAGG
jgi:uncharacterized NAD(P)/FAD-binding protein YdhS